VPLNAQHLYDEQQVDICALEGRYVIWYLLICMILVTKRSCFRGIEHIL
jgi:hypothetical protein